MANVEIKKFNNIELSVEIETVKVDEEIWFRGKDVADSLGYVKAPRAIHLHVDAEDKLPLSELEMRLPRTGLPKNTPLTWNEKQSIYINESGLYSLILHSKKPEAKVFKHWVTSEVLPAIRKTGSYSIPQAVKSPQIQILNETNLHYKVIDFIRKYHPEAILIPGLGEHQITTTSRSDAYYKGYKGGQPDILILNRHKTFSGMAIELKTPTGKGIVSENQRNCLDALKLNNYKVLISNDYDEIIVQVLEYCKDFRLQCSLCCRCFKTKDTLRNHLVGFHKVEDARL